MEHITYYGHITSVQQYTMSKKAYSILGITLTNLDIILYVIWHEPS